jgi:hypothetical protein
VAPLSISLKILLIIQPLQTLPLLPAPWEHLEGPPFEHWIMQRFVVVARWRDLLNVFQGEVCARDATASRGGRQSVERTEKSKCEGNSYLFHFLANLVQMSLE